MTLLQLEVFLAVCQARSFTQAGERLNMTQSAVSQAVANLERELGVTLLHRSRQGITITHIGERMLAHVREIARHTNCMQQEAAAAAGAETGTLRIASIPSVSAKLLPGMLASFKSSFPLVQTVMFEGGYEEVHSWLTNHVVDVGIVTLPVSGLDVVELVQDQLLLFLPETHALIRETAVSLAQIAQAPFIQPTADSEHVIREAFKNAGLTPNIQFEVRDTATILAMVQEGIGVTILPEMAISTSLPHVRSVPLHPPVTRRVGLAVRHLEEVSPICADFLLHARAYVQHTCPGCIGVADVCKACVDGG